MGVIIVCECGKILTKEEAEFSRLFPCTIFSCKIDKIRKKVDKIRRKTNKLAYNNIDE